MSASRQHDTLPAGFTRLGDLASIRANETWQLLVPLAARDAMSKAMQAALTDDDLDASPKGQAPDAATEPPAAGEPRGASLPSAKRSRVNAGRLRVFTPEALERARAGLEQLEKDQQKRSRPLLDRAADEDGFRLLPKVRPALKKLRAAQDQFNNLREPIDKLIVDLTLAGAMRPEDFRIRPILLAGDPGVGKTHFALQLAEALGVPMQKWSAANAQASFQLVGGASEWSQASPGLIFDLLAKGQSAAPVLILDEVDKIGDASRYPVLPALLELLEPLTARAFRNEYFGMEFDTSRMIVVLTANDLDHVPAPLLSRVEVFNVPAPEPEQRLRIIHWEFERLRRRTRRCMELDAAGSSALAERMDLDLRQTLRLVIDAFAVALTERQPVVMPKVPARKGRQTIGFVM